MSAFGGKADTTLASYRIVSCLTADVMPCSLDRPASQPSFRVSHLPKSVGRSVACNATKNELVPPVGAPQVNKINTLQPSETALALLGFQGVPSLGVPPQPTIRSGLLCGATSDVEGKADITSTSCHVSL